MGKTEWLETDFDWFDKITKESVYLNPHDSVYIQNLTKNAFEHAFEDKI